MYERGYLSNRLASLIKSLFHGPVSEAKPPVIDFVSGGLRRAVASLETSSEKPVWRCCMRLSMFADGTLFDTIRITACVDFIFRQTLFREGNKGTCT